MAKMDYPRKSNGESLEEFQSREGLRRAHLQSSPRASLAFSALDISDWVTQRFGRLLARFTPKISQAEPRNEPEAATEKSSKVRPAIIGQVLLVLVCLSAKPCLGGTIYNNLGSNNSFYTNLDYQTAGTYLATNFTATDGGRLDSILVPLFSQTSPVTISLYDDSNGQPGTVLESWVATVPGVAAQLATLTSVRHPSMFAGSKYWLEITQLIGLEVAWYQSNQTILGGYWAGGTPTQLLQENPNGQLPAIQVLSIDEPGPGCKSTYKSGTGPSFLQFCVTANGNMTVFQSPAGTLHFINNDRAEGYGVCDVNRKTSYFDYAAGGDSTNWDASIINQPNGPNTFPLTISRTTADGAFTLTQAFTSISAGRSVSVAMSLTNNSGFGKKIYLLRFAHMLANAAAPITATNFVDLTSASGSAWAYDRLGSGVMLSTAPTSIVHQGLVFATDSGPDPCNPLSTVVDPVAHPEMFPYQKTASLGTWYSFSIPAGKSVTVGVGYRPF